MDILISKKEICINGQSSPNTITLTDICEMLRKDKYYAYYQTVKERNDLLEDDDEHGVPMMNDIFYSRFAYCHTISYQFFLNEYKRVHCLRLPEGNMTFKSDEDRYQYCFLEQELDGKLLRGYMSFLKELYVLFSLIDIGYPARYSTQIDSDGFDIMLYNKYKHYYGIRVFSDTDKAKKFAKTKEQKRHDLQSYPCTVIALQAPMRKQVIGDTYVFTPEQINTLHNYILNNQQENITI